MTKRGLELNEANTEIMLILPEIRSKSANFERYQEIKQESSLKKRFHCLYSKVICKIPRIQTSRYQKFFQGTSKCVQKGFFIP